MTFRDPEAGDGIDAESRAWVEALRSPGAVGEKARRDLHLLMVRTARHEIRRRRESAPGVRGGEFEDYAYDSADRALAAARRSLDSYLGGSRFTTWASKFAVRAAAAGLRDQPDDQPESQLGCGQALGVLDIYVEIEVDEGPERAAEILGPVREHLDICSACAEDHASLLELIEARTG